MISICSRNILIGFVFLGSFIGFSCQQQSGDACYDFNKKYSKILNNEVQKKDTAILLTTLDEIILNSHACIDAHLTRGDIYLSLKKIINAKKDYCSVLSINKDNVYALYKLGILFQLDDIYDSSEVYFKKAINIKANGNFVVDFPKTNNKLINDKSKYDVEYDELVFSLGMSYYYARNLKGALYCFDGCIRNRYMLSDAYFYRGAIYTEIGKIERACDDFWRAKILGNSDVIDYIKKYCGGN